MKYKTWGVILLVGIVGIVLYYVFDPTAAEWFPKCRFYMLTGYKCPGCGMQRMLHSLLHGDVVAAFRYNAFLLTVFPVLIGLLAFDSWKKWLSKKCSFLSTYVIAGLLLASTLLWWILRNVYGW
jgi:hypothetical protein